MPLEYKFIVRDPVHGLMPFTEFERDIVDLPVFQRLRGLKQSSLAHLTYPTALTTRFEHSLGAAHVGGLIVEHLLRTDHNRFLLLVRRLRMHYRTILSRSTSRAVEQIHQGVRLACLLHDLGHLPFSHCFEHDFQDALSDPTIAKQWGANVANAWNALQESALQERAAPALPKFHEFLGAQIAEHNPALRVVVRRHDAMAAHTLALDILNPGRSRRARCPTLQNALGKIVHGEVDADRLDFVRRDPLMAGSGLGGFDIDRLIRSFALVLDGDDLALRPSIQGVSALEGFLAARLSTYRWQYHHYNVIYHDLLLKLVVRFLIKSTPPGHDSVDLVSDLSFENFRQGGLRARAALTAPLDDGFLLSRLIALQRSIVQGTHRRRGLQDERTQVMLNEVIFRAKRRIVLWKDHNGYLAFADALRSEIAKALAAHKRLSMSDARERTKQCWKEPGSCMESLLRFLRLKKKTGGLEGLQAWLWSHGCAWTVIDWREVAPFRRVGGGRAISEMEVVTRKGDRPSTRRFNELSTILVGFGDEEGKESRFFAYELLPLSARRLDRTTSRERADAGRRQLARTMARWLFAAPGVLDGLLESERKILLGE